MAYDFNYDLFALSPDKFRARWAPSLKDFNDEEILRMRAAATPPRRIVHGGQATNVAVVAAPETVVVKAVMIIPSWAVATVKLVSVFSANAADIPCPLYGGTVYTLEGDFTSVNPSDFGISDTAAVFFLGYTPE